MWRVLVIACHCSRRTIPLLRPPVTVHTPTFISTVSSFSLPFPLLHPLPRRPAARPPPPSLRPAGGAFHVSDAVSTTGYLLAPPTAKEQIRHSPLMVGPLSHAHPPRCNPGELMALLIQNRTRFEPFLWQGLCLSPKWSRDEILCASPLAKAWNSLVSLSILSLTATYFLALPPPPPVDEH